MKRSRDQEDFGFGHKKAERSKKKRTHREIMSTVEEKGVGPEPEVTPTPAEPTCSEDEAQTGKTCAAGRHYTVSIAVPGSIIENAQSAELKTYLAGQIARAAAVFNIDEVIVFNEGGSTGKLALPTVGRHQNDPNVFLSRILQYLETPQYLRKPLFPMHPDLKFVDSIPMGYVGELTDDETSCTFPSILLSHCHARPVHRPGLLNPLDCPHHMRMDEESEYREGVVLDRPIKSSGRKGSYADCGMRKNVQIDKQLKPGVRVTVKLNKPRKANPKYFTGQVVSPATPQRESGIYWGYGVRFAHSFGAVFTETPFEGGYDLTIGTSDSGDEIPKLSPFRHLLIVFGGLKGLEYSLECDENLQVDDVRLLFDHYLNTCPGQGSRTIRTEEAILISLSALRPQIYEAGLQTPQ